MEIAKRGNYPCDMGTFECMEVAPFNITIPAAAVPLPSSMVLCDRPQRT